MGEPGSRVSRFSSGFSLLDTLDSKKLIRQRFCANYIYSYILEHLLQFIVVLVSNFGTDILFSNGSFFLEIETKISLQKLTCLMEIFVISKWM